MNKKKVEKSKIDEAIELLQEYKKEGYGAEEIHLDIKSEFTEELIPGIYTPTSLPIVNLRIKLLK